MFQFLKPTPTKLGAFAAGGVIAGTRSYLKADKNPQEGLNTSTFTPFKLVSKESVSSTSAIFTLQATKPIRDALKQVKDSGVWSIQIKQPQLQIARSYTPLPPLDTQGSQNELRLLIRQEKNGEVSSYLHSLPKGGNVELRGPTLECTIGDQVEEVVFLAGGTGIAPALQIASMLKGSSKMSVLWANRRREDCMGGRSDNVAASSGWVSAIGGWLNSRPPIGEGNPDVVDVEESNALVKQLEHLKASYQASGGAKLQVDYFVDEEGSFVTKENVKRLTSTGDRLEDGNTADKRLVIVSGPEGFMDHWAGPKQWLDGREVQGPIGGALGQLQLKGWKVVKL